ncbi:YhcH/YjgK/YiaL family protein [Helicobacter cinaedi]|uniref:Flagellar motor-switch protein n=1 Tax=Helicobacter cinaedi TaxID=213 RepID=A0A377JR72_9HELI|nr:YhcH/YjgK/YiaL family protein [Helicobacter cinaedi]STP09522.1 flagellar motor-switch protein [Helicobacter cinaedi]
MAIIAQARTLEWFFKAYPQLNVVKEYISQALNPQSEIHKRISTLQIPQSQDRIEVSYPLEDGIRAIEQSYYLKSAQNAFFETHKAYLDFQLVISGYEYMCIGDKDTFDIKIPYDETRDLIVYENTLPQNLNIQSFSDRATQATQIQQFSSNDKNRVLESPYTLPNNETLNAPYRTQILLSSGDLAIFFPEDTHAGGLELTPDILPHSKIVKKSVLKVPVSLIL